jgi:hypothetical protein
MFDCERGDQRAMLPNRSVRRQDQTAVRRETDNGPPDVAVIVAYKYRARRYGKRPRSFRHHKF